MSGTDSMSAFKRNCIFLCRDLSLLVSLLLARLIVWRTLRARSKERAARIKMLRLVGRSGQTLNSRKALGPIRVDKKMEVARSGA
jgi:hypothetical protein